MSKGLFPYPLLKCISDDAREIRMLTGPHLPSYSTEIWTVSPLHLPDILSPASHLIDMGLTPALARRLSSVYIDFCAQYRQVFVSHFRRVIHDGCRHPKYYHDIFVAQFRRAIKVWESRIMSVAWVWLCRTGQPPAPVCPQLIDVRVDAATKAQILSRIGRITTPLIMNERANVIELPEEECKTEEKTSTKMLPASPPPPLQSTIPSTRDPFCQELPSTCFPASYPPPPGESISSHRRPLVTRFLLTTPAENKPSANCSVDMASLVTRLGRLSVTTSEVGLQAQENRTCAWVPRSKKSEPLTPLVSPLVAGADSSLKLQSSSTGTVLGAKPITTPRRRRIAALPMRNTKTTASPILDPSSPAANPPDPAPAPNITTLAPLSRPINLAITEKIPTGYIASPPTTIQYKSLSQPRYTAETSDILGSKSVVSERRKRKPLPRRVASQLQAIPSQSRLSIPPAPSGQRTHSSNVSRTPSLISDTSSCADSLSSSDELDSPPSTPPSHSRGFSARNASVASVISSKSNATGPFGLPIPTNADWSDPKKGKGTHIDFTNGNVMGEQKLNFTFRA